MVNATTDVGQFGCGLVLQCCSVIRLVTTEAILFGQQNPTRVDIPIFV